MTGGGSGIGRGVALTLGAEGMTVAVADIQQPNARAVAAEIESKGGRALAVGVDVTSVESLAAAAEEIVARAGGVNLLCANAGVLARVGPLADHTIGDWEYTLSVNVMGIVKTVDAFLPALRASAPDAHIVTTASLGGLTADVRAPIGAYVASKYACVGYSEMLRAELAREGIGVSVLCPGVVASNLTGTSAENRPGAFGAQAAPRLGPADAGGAGAPRPRCAGDARGGRGADRDPRDPGEPLPRAHPPADEAARRSPLPGDARRLRLRRGQLSEAVQQGLASALSRCENHIFVATRPRRRRRSDGPGTP